MSVINKSNVKFLRSTTAIALLTFSSLPAFGMEIDEDVVIIGGGMSGLTAAHALKKDGIKTTIYEGRERLGGRTHTHYFNENKTVFYEEGGTTIDDDHTAAIDLAQEVGVELIEKGYGSSKITVISQQKAQETDLLISELEKLRKELKSLNKTINWNDQMEYNARKGEFRDKPLLPHLSNLTPFAKDFLQTYYEDEVGASINQASVYSLLWLKKEMKRYSKLLSMRNNFFVPNVAIDKLAYHYNVKGGMSCFVNSLANKLGDDTTINLNHILTHIQKEDKYILTFKTEMGEKKITANRVIMTLPFSTLRHVTIEDSVGLSDYQKKAIKTLSYGTNSKIGIPVNSSKNIYDDMLFYSNTDDKLNGWPGDNALTFMINAEEGKNLTQEKANLIFSAQQKHISPEYSYIKSFGEAAFKNWSQDPFSFGSYSVECSINHDSQFLLPSNKEGLEKVKLYAEPLNDDHFIFAGEHTRADNSQSYIEGAIRSGHKAAEILKKSLKK